MFSLSYLLSTIICGRVGVTSPPIYYTKTLPFQTITLICHSFSPKFRSSGGYFPPAAGGRRRGGSGPKWSSYNFVLLLVTFFSSPSNFPRARHGRHASLGYRSVIFLSLLIPFIDGKNQNFERACLEITVVLGVRSKCGIFRDRQYWHQDS